MNRICLAIVFALASGSPLVAQAKQPATTAGEHLAAAVDGKTIRFSTKGHPKANGVSLSLEYPATMTPEEGLRPHIVQKFSGKVEGGAVSCLITIAALPPSILALPLSAEERLEILKGMPEEATVFAVVETKYEGIPGVMIMGQIVQERAGFLIIITFVAHRLLWAGSIVDVNVTYTVSPELIPDLVEFERVVKETAAKIGLLSRLIGNSIIVDRW